MGGHLRKGFFVRKVCNKFTKKLLCVAPHEVQTVKRWQFSNKMLLQVAAAEVLLLRRKELATHADSRHI